MAKIVLTGEGAATDSPTWIGMGTVLKTVTVLAGRVIVCFNAKLLVTVTVDPIVVLWVTVVGAEVVIVVAKTLVEMLIKKKDFAGCGAYGYGPEQVGGGEGMHRLEYQARS